ncbi:2-oxoglutarate-Fe(II) type oxidoreductase hxnY [Drechslerella dactyloides]|uniref:2-oxoglutarate-Fe(II) type oxidoreductase hxnY n=1 Tax=Drechslerella dactyloides TaxID=74499 RepID=A0AAD6NFL2_DREDA|nr:2-oxoglutarate-Fe(II) type oxidoreductase hxnY [Drechslerella dactyloides]
MTDSGTEVLTGNGTRKILSNSIDIKVGSFSSIPILDLSLAFSEDLDLRNRCAEQLFDACTRVGFFYIKNHGVPQETVANCFCVARQFFDLSLEEKMKIYIKDSDNYKGYTPLLGENTDPTGRGDLHEGFDVGYDSKTGKNEMEGENRWPENLPEIKQPVTDYFNSMVQLGTKLFQLFALSLDLDEHHFDGMVSGKGGVMRLLHYPPQKDENINLNQLGIGAHSDYECFTMLAQDDVPALQVLNAEGQWVAAVPIEGTFVVNVGDSMARWTNDLYLSTIHRAINRTGIRRYSIPFFFGVDYETTIEVLESCTSPARPPKYKPINAGQYIKQRLNETY